MTTSQLAQVEPARIVALYEQAERSLAEAVTLLDVMSVRNLSEMLKAQAKLIRDPEAQAQAYLLRTKAERKLGEFLRAARERGELNLGGRPTKAGGGLDRVTLDDAGINRKLSMQAQKLAGFDARQFAAVLEAGAAKIRSGKAVVINPVRDLTTQDKQLRRAIRAAQLANRQKAMPTVKAGVIVADPAWEDEDIWSAETGMERAPDNHYPVMKLADIMALDVGSRAADDCILFLWAKSNNLMEAICTAMAWGFAALAVEPKTHRLVPDKTFARYVTNIAWDKMAIGMGRWVRDQHELLLIFTRGKPVPPAPGMQLRSVFQQMKTEHSAKPEGLLEWIEHTWPDATKLELNRRGPARPGWVAWGNEAEEQDETSSQPLGTTVQDLSAEAGSTSLAGAEGEADRHSNSPEGGATRSAPTAGLLPSGETVRQDEPADPAGGATHGASGRRESLTKPTTGNAATVDDPDQVIVATAGRESEVGSAGGRDPDPTSLDDVTGGESAASEGAPVAPATAPASEPALAAQIPVAAKPEDLPGAREAASGEVGGGTRTLRRSRAGLGSRERQRASASAFATQQNNDRAVGRSGRGADRTEPNDERAGA